MFSMILMVNPKAPRHHMLKGLMLSTCWGETGLSEAFQLGPPEASCLGAQWCPDIGDATSQTASPKAAFCYEHLVTRWMILDDSGKRYLGGRWPKSTFAKARLLPQKKQRADERFAMGEKVAVPLWPECS